MTDEPLAPLSGEELADLRRVLGILKHPPSSGQHVYAQGRAIEAFERLLAMARREAALQSTRQIILGFINEHGGLMKIQNDPCLTNELCNRVAWLAVSSGQPHDG